MNNFNFVILCGKKIKSNSISLILFFWFNLRSYDLIDWILKLKIFDNVHLFIDSDLQIQTWSHLI